MQLTRWDKRFIEMARLVATWSEDPDRQVGCVIVGPAQDIRALGYNGLPRLLSSGHPARLQRANGEKYRWIEHAERNAVYAAAKSGVELDGTTMYLTWFPCVDCARAIIQSGVQHLIARSPDFGDPAWGAQFELAHAMLIEAKVSVDLFDD